MPECEFHLYCWNCPACRFRRELALTRMRIAAREGLPEFSVLLEQMREVKREDPPPSGRTYIRVRS